MNRKIKPAAALFSSALLALSMMPFAAGAETVETDDYTLDVDGSEATIVKYIGEDEDVVIPSEIEGHKITVIGDESFKSNADIVSITIPEGVTKIGGHAFAVDKGIESVTLPSTLVEIGEAAFQQCSSLSTVTFSGDEAAWQAVTIGAENELLTAVTPTYSGAPADDAGTESSADTSSADSSGEESSSAEASSEETAAAETTSEESSSAVSNDTTSDDTTTAAENTGAGEDASETEVPPSFGVNIPYLLGGIVIGVAVLDILYYSIKKPQPPTPEIPDNNGGYGQR